MDILDRLTGHDAWTTRQLLLFCQNLPDDVLDHQFNFGQETLRKTFVHIIDNMEVWTGLMTEQPAWYQPHASPPGASIPEQLERLDAISAKFIRAARDIQERGLLDECFTDVLDNPPRQKTFGGAIVHLTTHSMHHRAQILAMLDILGVEHEIEGDALGWERRMREAATER